MGRTLSEMIDALPKQRRERIDARYLELRDDVESLRELRKLAGKAQADIAATLKIQQPSASKIEKQTDMYLSTLRSYVEAIGGKLDLIVRLPSRRAIHLNQLGEVAGRTGETSATTARCTVFQPMCRARESPEGAKNP
jgi:DNA-binding XRE family transcriptional regulator